MLAVACKPVPAQSQTATNITASTQVDETDSEDTAATQTVPATSTPFATLEPDAWESAPIIPEALSERAKEIYARGQEIGRDAHVFSKVGDCGGTPSWFLGPFDLGDYRLGDYGELEAVIEYYAGSYNRTSLAVHEGFNTASILSPIRADPKQCQPGEDPIACEYNLNNPSLALIMLGTNDKFRVDSFEAAMRQIIEYTIDQGILPVIASKPDNIEGDHSINRMLYALAVEYELPFWNLWRAVKDLPNGGLQEDGAHMTWAPNNFDNKFDMRAGWPNRNLTALQVLDMIWRQLQEP